jgi:hypothetical protein
MKRKIILSREAVLWEAGDAARTFAVLESGKLGSTDQGSGHRDPGHGPRRNRSPRSKASLRNASAFAIEEGTTVTEYPASSPSRASRTLHAVAKALLATLLGRSRGTASSSSTNKHDAMFSIPFDAHAGPAQTYKPASRS